MPYVKYIGLEAEVDVPALNLVVKRNETIEVPADQVDGLVCQTDNWKKTTATKSAQTAEEED